jgi:hypothetical protein
MVYVTHLLDLQVFMGSFETNQWKKRYTTFLKADAYWDWIQLAEV